MFVWWGSELVNLYNDAYVPMLGKRHPQAFGRPAKECWSDIWDVLDPQVEQVLNEGIPTWNERVLLVMERNGYPEDTYFTWSYSPIFAEDGSIGGLFCACSEETARVAAERDRDRLIQDAQDALVTLKTGSTMRPVSSRCCADRSSCSTW
jgi:PAS domain-containing protein